MNWILASLGIALAITLQGCDEPDCDSAKSEDDCKSVDGRCYWAGCEHRKMYCGDSYGDSVDTYCQCELETVPAPTPPGDQVRDFCKGNETGGIDNPPMSEDGCAKPGGGCECYKCVGVLAAGRIYSTGSGALTARVIACRSSVNNGNTPTSSKCDWSLWPSDVPHDEVPLISVGGKPLNDEIATYYETVGLAEHASVASFSRAVLELMEHGAPAGLLDRTLAAAREEVQHAQMAFALARIWSDAPIQVTGLDARLGELTGTGLAAFARRAATEACAGETPAVLRAAVARRFAQDTHVRTYLSAVLAEERRHAELAWATLGWALLEEEQGNGGRQSEGIVRQAAAEALASAGADLWKQARSSVHPDPDLKKTRGLLQVGILSVEIEAAVARIAAALVEKLRSELVHEDLLAHGLGHLESRVREHFDGAIEEAMAVNSGSELEEHHLV